MRRSAACRTVDGSVETVLADVSDIAQVEAVVARAVERFGRLDVLISNAGVLSPNGRIHNLSTEDWERAFRINVLGAVNGIRAAVPVMRTQQSGSIVLTASVSGLTAWSHAAPYCATKAAVIQLAKVAAVEYARDGIRVELRVPGVVPLGHPRRPARAGDRRDRGQASRWGSERPTTWSGRTPTWPATRRAGRPGRRWSSTVGTRRRDGDGPENEKEEKPMSMITLEKLSATVGAAVVGLDPERLLDDETLAPWALDALDQHGVFVFRGLHLDDATQVAFSKRLGRVEVLGKGDHPEIFRVTLDPAKNPVAGYLRGTFDWHIDGMTEDIPIMATLLAAHAIAASGGQTEFASTYAAYDDLTDEEKERFASIRVIHTLEATQRLVNPDPTPEEVAMWRQRPPKEHPLVWTHLSGRRSLVLGATTASVVGMEPAEGRSFLDGLLERATAPDRIYRHEWEVGDLVIWDNTGVLHRALRYDATSPRDMHRTTLYGKEAVQ